MHVRHVAHSVYRPAAAVVADPLGVNAVADGPSQFDAVQQTPILDAMVARGVDAICIAATYGVTLVFGESAYPTEFAESNIRLSELPTELGDWVGEDTEIDKTVMELKKILLGVLQ